ncbi:right-handed parallel beta-helix repeat-containing protein [Candidatus Dojkabacteria bacterium]|jgi:hypothetical protein|nr:right-handed parallel beta-helix repeat-containing protein [Candidatus Dojkabacteria bacterium]
MADKNIYSYGFDKGLKREIKDNSTGVVYDYLRNQINTGQIMDRGNLNLGESNLRLYDAVVDVNYWGDYTDIQSALDAGHKRIFLRNGTYIINNSIRILGNNISITGEDRNNTIIKANNNLSNAINIIEIGDTSLAGGGASSNEIISNLTIDGNSDNNTQNHTGIYIYDNEDHIIENCNIKNCGNYGLNIYSGNDGSSNIYIRNNIFSNNENAIYTTASSSFILSNDFTQTTTSNISGQLFAYNISNNRFSGGTYHINITGSDRNIISSNYFYSTDGNMILFDYTTANTECKYNIISNNSFQTFGGASTAQEDVIVFSGAQYNEISNNIFYGSFFKTNDTYAFILLKTDTSYSIYNNICGNTIFQSQAVASKAKYGIVEFDSNQDYNIISNNIVQGAVTANFLIQGANTISENNGNASELEKNKIVKMKNTSGAGLRLGNVVSFKAVAAGDEVTTTTTIGDDLSFGMVTETINNNNYGNIKTEGKTLDLWVNNSATSISIGDYLSTYSHAYYANKAVVGDMAFAIALEAPTTSTAQISALLVSPRKI